MKKRADGRYQKAITINGRKQFFYGKSPAEVNKKILAFQEKKATGRLFSEVAEEWYDKIVKEISPNTIAGYLSAKKDAINMFGNMPIKDISAIDINNYLISLKQKGFAYKTVITKLQIVRQIISYAMLNGEAHSNPADIVKVPKNLTKKTRESASQLDIEKIKVTNNLLALTALYTGCRKGELLALHIDDFDFINNTITINKSVYHDGKYPHLKEPKTKAGIRTIPLLEPLKKVIESLKIKGYLFNCDGNLLTKWQARDMWNKFCKEYQVECTLHQLRHAYATRLYELNIDIKSAQELLGHSDTKTTSDIYTHITEMKRKLTADKLADF